MAEKKINREVLKKDALLLLEDLKVFHKKYQEYLKKYGEEDLNEEDDFWWESDPELREADSEFKRLVGEIN